MDETFKQLDALRGSGKITPKSKKEIEKYFLKLDKF